MDALVIGVTTRHARGPDFHKFASTCVRIGRGLHNDLILVDPFLGAEQFCIRREDGALFLDVLDATNPATLNGVRIAGGSAPLAFGDRIAIASLQFTVFSEATPVAPARVLDDAPWPRAERWRPQLAALAVVATAVLATLMAVLGAVEDIVWTRLLGDAVMVVVMMLLWAFGWALLGRLLRNQPQFSGQLLATALFTLCSIPLSVAVEYAAYASGLTDWAFAIDAVTGGVLLCALLRLNLRMATSLQRPGVSALAFVATLGLLSWVLQLQARDEFEPRPADPGVLKPPFAKLRRGMEPAAWERAAGEVFAAAREATGS